jgi:hypothetical protein
MMKIWPTRAGSFSAGFGASAFARSSRMRSSACAEKGVPG